MKRLRRVHQIEAAAGVRLEHLLADLDAHAGNPLAQHRSHLRAGLERNDLGTARSEHQRRLPVPAPTSSARWAPPRAITSSIAASGYAGRAASYATALRSNDTRRS